MDRNRGELVLARGSGGRSVASQERPIDPPSPQQPPLEPPKPAEPPATPPPHKAPPEQTPPPAPPAPPDRPEPSGRSSADVGERVGLGESASRLSCLQRRSLAALEAHTVGAVFVDKQAATADRSQ